MPDFMGDWLGLALLLCCALVLVAISGAATVWFGFAWAFIITVVVGALIYRWMPIGTYGEGAHVIIIAWILLAIGLVIGLLIGLAPS
ncbi:MULTISPECIES: hypothetical protein [unclassified Brevundimonas]|jgi:hypothetical protein|uniref:hypothetical protein n=1 Tax=unclassified Brevundimonas TaxID=2622653 RepID=UPI000C658FA1|nr:MULTISPECIES: hypothetical protein [unclassified Brevundimonas]MAL88593.1 hypothetical protein [Brevundimonas sp.]MAL89682.1 hypothetical protein [Brevundimonas sp.]HAJ02615.1 hypothetical protein [Brevundimonas sp.]HAV51590.1 hypothetical protein [Brevundimonas sp.]|tara:strand:+ start:14162 stop:14422 length:261 start_codon:yes stop_codon:yes gene_type:complete